MKTLKQEFIDKTLSKIETVINCVLEHHGVNMSYDLSKRNELFCEIIQKTTQDLATTEMFESIMTTLRTSQTDLTVEQSDWLSEQIYQFNRDIFLLHYFYAILYSYNYDVEIQNKVTEEHIKGFFDKANAIHKKYKDLTFAE